MIPWCNSENDQERRGQGGVQRSLLYWIDASWILFDSQEDQLNALDFKRLWCQKLDIDVLCSFSKVRRPGKRNGYHPLGLGLYPLHVVLVDLYSFHSRNNWTLLVVIWQDMGVSSSQKIFHSRVRGIQNIFQFFALQLFSGRGGEFVDLDSLFLFRNRRKHTGRSVIVVWSESREKLQSFAQQMISALSKQSFCWMMSMLSVIHWKTSEYWSIPCW